MQANLVRLKDPFRPSIKRDYVAVKPGIQLRTVLKRQELIKNGKRTSPYIVILNGEPIVERNWNIKIKADDQIVVSHLPAGGGGSNPLQIVLLVAVAVASAYTGGLAAAAYGAGAGAAASLAVSLGGALLMQVMFPPSTPSVASATNNQASPTYSLSAQGNSARLLGAIPCLYGRMKINPDFAAAPYTEIQGNDQYLYQLFCLSQGKVSIESIRIEDTDIGSYAEVQTEVVQPYQSVTLFPTNVDTSTEVASQVLYGPNDPSYAVIGPFVSAPAGSTTTAIGLDVTLPNGAYVVDDSGNLKPTTVSYLFEAQKIDDNGAAQGDWFTLVSNSVSFADKTPQRLTHKIAVGNGRYQVRGHRTNNSATDSRTSDTLTWDNMRAYLTDVSNFGNVTLLAVVMKATNQLSSASSRTINVICTRMLNTWDPVNGWTLVPTATRNPAWAIADIIKNPIYGRNLPDSRYNIQKLFQLSQTWDARGDTFNYVFDTISQLWDALQKVCKAGRTTPIYYAGLIDFIRNEPLSVPSSMFQPQNMTKGSFQTTYQFAEVDTPDYVVIQFHNELTWQDDTVDCILPGHTSNTPSTVELVGVTNQAQAWREGITLAAANLLQRRTITFNTELEGLLPAYGDLCQISHDVPAWGYSGRVKTFDQNTGYLTGSENFIFNPGEDHVIAFRRRNGSADGPYPVIPSPRGIPNEIVVINDATQKGSIYVSDGIREEFTTYQFGPVGRAGLLAQLFSSTPQGDDTVALTFVNYDPNVFAAENGGIIPDPSPVSNLPGAPKLPIIDTVSLQYSYVVGQQTIVASKANGAQYYEFEASPDRGVTWINFGTAIDPQMDVALNVGEWYIRVRGIGLLKGPWTTIDVQVAATTLPLVGISAFTTTGVIFGIKLDWVIAVNNGGIAQKVQIWQSASNSLPNANLLTELPPSVSTFTAGGGQMGIGETHYYWIRVIDQAGRAGPWYNNAIGTLGQSSSNYGLIKSYLVGQLDQSLLVQDLLTKVNQGAAAYVGVNQTTSALAAMYTIKTQLTVDGITYIAGIGVGVENDAGVVISTVVLAAQRFAVLDPTRSGSARYPFIISNGIVFMDTAFIQDATITTAKIQDASITNAKIGTAAIGTANIADGTITTAKIANAQITNALIADANITTAKIGTAQIDTLRIGPNAVTTLVSQNVSGGGSMAYTSTGGQVQITANGAANGTITLSIDGTQVAALPMTTANAAASISYTLTLAAGAHTISTSGWSTLYNCVLSVFEAKR